MGALVEGTDFFVRRLGGEGATEVIVYTIATVDDGDTIALTLADYGIATDGFLACDGYIQSTANSIIVAEAPTTAVSAGVLTITVGGSTDNKKRTYRVLGI